MSQSKETEWRCHFLDTRWCAVSCQLRPGSCCGSYVLPSRPCYTATLTIPAAQSQTPLKTESSSHYLWSCSIIRTRILLFRTKSVTVRWTDDMDHFLNVHVGSVGWYRGTRKDDGISCI